MVLSCCTSFVMTHCNLFVKGLGHAVLGNFVSSHQGILQLPRDIFTKRKTQGDYYNLVQELKLGDREFYFR